MGALPKMLGVHSPLPSIDRPHVNEFVTSVIELVSSRTVESVGLDAESCAVFAKCL